MNIRQKPYHLLGLTGLTSALVSLLPMRYLLSVNFHDTYFVMPYIAFLRCWAVLLLAFWGLNALGASALQSARLTRVHTIALLMAFVASHLLLLDPEPMFYYRLSQRVGVDFYWLMLLTPLVMMAALLTAFIMLLTNFALSLRLRRTQ